MARRVQGACDSGWDRATGPPRTVVNERSAARTSKALGASLPGAGIEPPTVRVPGRKRPPGARSGRAGDTCQGTYEQWLRSGLTDYLGLWEFAEQERLGVPFDHRHDDDVRVAVIEMLRHMLEAGWLALGDYTAGSFVSLSLTTAEVIDRVDRAWATATDPHFDMGIWFALTPVGEGVARSLPRSEPPSYMCRYRSQAGGTARFGRRS